MILKASQRGGGQQLATHLLNSFDNDRVEVAYLRGAIARDLHGAFAEWLAHSKATKCRKYLYSLSVNPDPQQPPVTREQYLDFIERTEKKLGLSEQARAVVFHVKHGREHAHVVWSRIDIDKLKAVQLSHDHQQLRMVVRAFARDHNIKLPPGVANDKGKARFNERAKVEKLREQQQEERTGITKQERMLLITQAWRETSTGQELIAALEKRGYYLARGDQRSYVVVDRGGEIHSLARQIDGAKQKDVDARLAGYPIDKLPDAKKAQEFVRKKNDQERAKLEPSRKEKADERRAALDAKHRERRAALDVKHNALQEQHRSEREALTEAHASQTKGVLSERLLKQSKGIVAFLQRITGLKMLAQHRQKQQDAQRQQEQQRQREALERRHDREMQDFRRHYHALDSLDKREVRSLETAIRREEFRTIARPRVPELGKTFAPAAKMPPDKAMVSGLAPEHRTALEMFLENARDIATPEARQPEKQSQEPPRPGPQPTESQEREPKTIAPDFNEMVQAPAGKEAPQPEKKGLLSRMFRKLAGKEEPAQTERQNGGSEGKAPETSPDRTEPAVREAFAEAASPGLPDELDEALKARAEQKKKQAERNRGQQRDKGRDRER